MRQALILAGGKGTRLRSRLGDSPKPLIDIGGQPLLGRQLDLLAAHGFDDVIVLVSYQAEKIKAFCADRRDSPMRITIIDDGEPRGTAGAVLAAFPHLAEQFVVLYGDTMLDVDLTRFWRWHESAPDTAASLFLHPNDHPQDSDLVEIDESDRIIKFHSYPHPHGAWFRNLVNAALYIVRREALAEWVNRAPPLDFAKDLFPDMLAAGACLRGYVSPEYIKDAGTPTRLDKVCRDLVEGTIERASLRHRQRAVFADRDGTLNEENGYVTRAEDLELFDFVGPSLRRLNEASWRTVLVTNQPVLARGDTSFEEMRRIHGRLESEVAHHHAYFDRIYMCPHHPDGGFQGEIEALKTICDCRKPQPGLIRRAEADLNLDLRSCWFIGDSTSDLGAAHAAGVTSILVETGQGGLDDRYPVDADFTAANFAAAVDFILYDYPRLVALCGALSDSLTRGSDWFIGGLSRSGKSTLASVLSRELRDRGVACEVIRLDNWLLAEADRKSGVLGRYDMVELERSYQMVRSRRDGPVELSVPHYSRRRKKPLPIQGVRRFDPGCVVIWEGVVAIPFAERLDQLDRTIFVDAVEADRIERVIDFYAARGASRDDTLALLARREADEHVPIRATRGLAAKVIALDNNRKTNGRPDGDCL